MSDNSYKELFNKLSEETKTYKMPSVPEPFYPEIKAPKFEIPKMKYENSVFKAMTDDINKVANQQIQAIKEQTDKQIQAIKKNADAQINNANKLAKSSNRKSILALIIAFVSMFISFSQTNLYTELINTISQLLQEWI